jgi:ubiquinone/menaquinone biosynthesis C-methylase UbiE
VPRLLEPTNGYEGFIRVVYELFAPFHDIGVRYGLPLATFATEEETREAYMRRLDVEGIARERRDAGPARILDVGIGSGGNLPHLAHHLPAGVDAEIWGVDFSTQMLRQCRRRLATWDGSPVHLLLGDAHALPFADASFDRVLHVGGINTHRDPARAFAEMARVSRPGTPIIVVDEQLDPDAGWYQRWMFRWITLLDRVAHAPVEHVPRGATDVRVTQVNSFYYCLSFRTPAIT